VRAGLLTSWWRGLVVGVVVLGLGAASAVAAGRSGSLAPLLATGTNPISGSVSRAVIVRRSSAGSTLSLTIACRGGSPGAVCSGPITLNSSGFPPEEVGSSSYSVPTGHQATVAVDLNRDGLALLAWARYRLSATLTLAGTPAITKTVHFHYRLIGARLVDVYSTPEPGSTDFTKLELIMAPADASLGVTCVGHGCPFASRSFSPSGGKVVLTPSFKGQHLLSGTYIKVVATATNSVARLYTIQITSAGEPTFAKQCFAPDAPRPARC